MEPGMRYRQLDALRGLAALTVVFSHFALLSPMLALRRLPLRLLGGGHEAVILFFVLSGFVLSLQINGERRLGYGEYAIRRICRIYLPYLGAVAVAYIGYSFAYSGDVDWAGSWFNLCWQPALPDGSLTQHLLFVFPFETFRLDPIVWSLVYEMRISLLFMPVMLLVFNMPTWRALCGAALLSLAVCTYAWHVNHHHQLLQASAFAEWLPTLHYLLMFAAGAALAKHRGDISTRLKRAPAATWIGWILLLGSLVVYETSWRIAGLAPDILRFYLYDWTVLIAVCGIIACAVGFPPFARLLQMPPLPFFGKISYSLYLYHAVVLFAVVHLVGERLGAGLSLGLAAALIVPVSYAGYLFVERPAMRLGSHLARKYLARRMLADAAANN